jgi:hypothetical protein
MSARDDWKDAGDALSDLLERAQRASEVRMSDSDSAQIWEKVHAGRRIGVPPLGWIAGLAAALAVAAGLASVRRPAPIEIVKEVGFESVHDGKTVRFEMIVYREAKKEKNDADKPTL